MCVMLVFHSDKIVLLITITINMNAILKLNFILRFKTDRGTSFDYVAALRLNEETFKK